MIRYAIQAEVVDITRDMPKQQDRLLVDTNIWYWLTYSRASQSARPPAQYQTRHYPEYSNAALRIGATLLQTGLHLAELSHLIEKAEREIYQAANGPIGAKAYRHNLADERARVCAEIQAVWAQVTTLADFLSVTIDGATVDAALNRLLNQNLDGYDLFLLETMNKNGVSQILTDDGDFATVPDIVVFTANRNVLRAAEAQGRLLQR